MRVLGLSFFQFMLYPDLIVFNANLITLSKPNARAAALAVQGDKIVFVGSDAETLSLRGPNTQTIDLRGKTVTPGFCDAHLHLAWYGTLLLRQADLVGSDTVEEILSRLSAHGKTYDGLWIQGHGFDQDKLPGGNFPTRADLDRVSPTRPIIISRICGHAAVVNSAALALVTDAERASGNPETGLYTEGDISAFYRRIPALSEMELETAVLRAASVALRTGITSVGTLLDVPEQMGAYHRLRRKGKLPLRVTGMPPYTSVDALHKNGIGTTFGDEWVRMGGAKLFSDGSLGARTALLAAPYTDENKPENLGIRIYEPEDLKAKARDAHEKGFQIVIHAIGDQAVRESVAAITHALGDEGDNTFFRHRIEHASLLPPEQMQIMAQRKIVAVVQPQFVISDSWTGERVGPERAKWAYPFAQMEEAGIPLALSSDCPVEKLDAFACLAAAVGRHSWSPNGGLSPEAALRAYCVGGAYSLHAEERVGTLAPQMLADFVVLSDDPTKLDAEGIAKLKAEQVFVGGQLVQ